MIMISNWRIYCNTEDQWTFGWQVSPPTVCFNNPAHTVNPNSVSNVPGTDGVGTTQVIKDVKAGNTAGGTISANTWTTKDLNSIEGTAGDYVSLSANQITIQPGIYYVDAQSPVFSVGSHQCRLRDVDNNITIALGSSESTLTAVLTTTQNKSILRTTLGIQDPTTFELQHYVGLTNIGDGMGLATGFGFGQVYTQVIITKLK